MKRRTLALLLTAAMVISCLAGCGGQSEPPAQSPAPAPASPASQAPETPQEPGAKYAVTEPVTIEFWYAGSGNEEFYNQVAEEFNSSQDKVTVVPVCGGNYASINEQIIGAQAAGTGLPGISVVNYSTLPNYVQSGVAEPLDDYLADYQVDMNDYIPGFLSVGNYDGVQFGMPHGVSCFVYYYNKDILKEKNLPDFPTTWDEFKTWAMEVHKATGKPAYLMAANEKTVNYNMMQNFGGTFIKEDNTTGLDAETLKTHMREMKELIDAGAVEWSLDSSDILSSKFINGEVVSYNLSCTSYSKFIQNDFDVGIAWNFKSEDNISTVTGSYLFIPAANDQNVKNAGFAFLNYLCTPDVNYRWAKFSSYLTSCNSVFNDEQKMADIYTALPEMRNVYGNSDKMVSKPKTTKYDSGIKAYYTALSKIYLEGADFDPTWDAMVEEVNYILSD